MESPPPLQGRQPLGRTFWILLVAPIAAMGLAAGISVIDRSPSRDSGILVSWIALLAMLVCSILCAIIAGKRWSAGLGVLMFFGIQVVYIAVAFAGCATVASGLNFH